ncbi:MAG: hypothetical protein ACTHO8_06945 [Solirubrobacterales bacterium]
MKNLKSFVLAVAAAAMLLAFAGVGSASATELTCGREMCAAETTIKAVSEGKTVFDEPFGNLECEVTLEGHTENTGSATETIKIPLTTLTFTNCGGDTVSVLHAGSLEVHWKEGGNNATLTWTGAEITVVHLGTHCIFTPINTPIGTLTGSASTGSNATLDISAFIPRTGGNSGAFCGSSMPWTGSYKFTTPSTLNID